MSRTEAIDPKIVEDWGLEADATAVPQLIDALNNNADVRWDAAWALGQIADRSAVPHLINVLSDHDPNVRKRAAYSLGEIGDDSAKAPLRQLLEDTDEYVRSAAEWALERLPDIYEVTEIIVFGTGEAEELEGQNVLQDHDLADVKTPMSNLQRIIVYADTCNLDLIESFFAYSQEHLGQSYLGENIDVVFYGDPDQFDSKLYNNFENLCRSVEVYNEGVHEETIQDEEEISEEKIYETTEIIIFGAGDIEDADSQHVLQDPDLAGVTTKMSNLYQLIVHAETCNKALIEGFFTYAQKHLPTNYLKEHVVVRIYGDPDDLASKTYRKLVERCQSDYAATEVIIFGTGEVEVSEHQITLRNPNLSEITISMSNIQKILVHTETCEAGLLESFFAYAQEHLGQGYLKKNVEASLYGDQKDLDTNIYNNFKNLCKKVEIYKEA